MVCLNLQQVDEHSTVITSPVKKKKRRAMKHNSLNLKKNYYKYNMPHTSQRRPKCAYLFCLQ